MTVSPSTLRPAPDGGYHFQTYDSGRYPFQQFDYVEQEWIASGVENGHRYETTVLLRMPGDPARFSGVVLVEPLHFHGITPMSLYVSTWLMRSGHGWAMVTSQRTTIVDHVQPSNPERYASLEIEGPGGLVSQSDLDFTDDEGMAAFWRNVKASNRASSTILAQVGAALRDGAPFDGRPLRHLLLMGHSQTGSVVTYYLQEAHASERMPDGRSVYDGYAPTGFPAGALGPCEVPIVQIMSDGDVSNPAGTFITTHPGRQYRRDDADAPTDKFRLYELAGVPHMGTRYPPFDGVDLWRATNPNFYIADDTRMNTLPHNELFCACMEHLVRWVVDGVTPPRAERITTGSDGAFVLDGDGNTLGGVRCGQMYVPRARYLPNLPNPDGTLSINTVGTEEAFDATTMARLYGTAEVYRVRFEARLAELIAAGWLLAEDAEAMRQDLARLPEF